MSIRNIPIHVLLARFFFCEVDAHLRWTPWQGWQFDSLTCYGNVMVFKNERFCKHCGQADRVALELPTHGYVELSRRGRTADEIIQQALPKVLPDIKSIDPGSRKDRLKRAAMKVQQMYGEPRTVR